MFRIFIIKVNLQLGMAQFGPIVMCEARTDIEPTAIINIEVGKEPTVFGIDDEGLPFIKRQKGCVYPRLSGNSAGKYKSYVTLYEKSISVINPENEVLMFAIDYDDDVVIDKDAVTAVIKAAAENPGKTFTTDTIN